MGKKNTWNQKNLESRGNHRSSKDFTKGFGIVRMLTNSSQKDIFHIIQEQSDLSHEVLRRKAPLHVTVIQFVSMKKHEQAAFQAGFSVARLEDKLENGVADEAARVPITVELGAFALAGNVLYSSIEDNRLKTEQTHLAGQVAMHGIDAHRINKRILPPHLSIGFVQGSPAEEIREEVENVLYGETVKLERWNVYPDRYA